MLADLRAAGAISPQGERHRSVLGLGLLQLIGGDALRPALPWLLSTGSPTRIAGEMARVRDPGGIAALKALREASAAGDATFTPAIERVALIMAAKGGLVSDITPGDCMELLDCCSRLFTGGGQQAWQHSPFFYQLLHSAGIFPDSAPATVRMISTRFPGQLSVEQLVDRYDLACRPIRDLLVDYLRERQPGIDYSTLNGLAATLALRFWKDLETHHPGIDSLRLPPDIAVGWKRRNQTRTARTPGGGEQAVARESADHILVTVRAFYLDLGQWALDEPARWGPWAVPCPVRGSDIQYKKQKSRTKARMDQRTRERLPLLPALAAAVDRGRKDAAARLDAARATPPGELFTVGGQTLRRARLTRSSRRIWAEDPGSGKRRDLTLEEDNAFWAWAAIEVLRHTGIRIEELTELSHHSLVQYRLPSSGDLVPLLSVAPSKTDQERLLVIDPELADVLSAVITRVRGSDGAVPAAAAYDSRERTWNPPMPAAVPAGHRPGEPADPRRRHPRPPPRRTRRVRHHRHRREAGRLPAPRLPEALHDRRHPERNAAPHRPADTRAQRHQHHHGIQNGLSRGGHTRSPGIHHPPPRTPAQRRIPLPERPGVGRVPRPLRAPPGRARRLRPGIRDSLHP